MIQITLILELLSLNADILSSKLFVEELKKQYDLRILSLENEVIRLHSLLEKALLR
jgi:hypothetical protein